MSTIGIRKTCFRHIPDMTWMPGAAGRRAFTHASIAFAMASAGLAENNAAIGPAQQLPAKPEVSIMSYNVKGLPWPVATGRNHALAAIARQLAAMRAAGNQPQVVLLQEAFTDEAKDIGEVAGYRFAVGGPSSSQINSTKASASIASFAHDASWLKGETEGKWLDSGLRILSDYPIVAVRRMAFPTYACAGYDCLANKGAVIAWIDVPGSARPVAFIDTHLNSRGASGVADARSDTAYSLQLQCLRRFIASELPADTPAILGGDFNTGKATDRLIQMRESPLPGGRNSLETALLKPAAVPAGSLRDAWAILDRGKDWLFYRPGVQTGIKLASFTVPFGTEPDGSSLSDHMGYVVRYSFGRVSPSSPLPSGKIS